MMDMEIADERPFVEDFGPEVGAEAPQEEETVVDDATLLKKAQEFAVLNERKRQLTKELDDVKEKMDAINQLICEKMIFENPNIKVKVGEDSKGKPKFKTVFVKSTIWAGYDEDKSALMEALKKCGLEDMVTETFNVQTLSAYVRAFDPDKAKTLEELKSSLPEEIQPHIKLSRVDAVAVKS